MDEWFSILILALVQGITEWLPISSSGHLLLTEYITGYDVTLALEMALHFGTLMAVFVFFGKDIIAIAEDVLKGRWKSDNGKTGLFLIVATIPAAVVGFLVKDYFDLYFTTLPVITFGFAITGVLLLLAAFYRPKEERALNWKIALLVGCAQAVALVPAISRAGSTLALGLLLGLSERKALRFSFLMAIPVIFGATILTLGTTQLPQTLIWATLLCFIIALGVLYLIYNKVLVHRKNLRWFALYCLLLALTLGIVLFFN